MKETILEKTEGRVSYHGHNILRQSGYCSMRLMACE